MPKQYRVRNLNQPGIEHDLQEEIIKLEREVFRLANDREKLYVEVDNLKQDTKYRNRWDDLYNEGLRRMRFSLYLNLTAVMAFMVLSGLSTVWWTTIVMNALVGVMVGASMYGIHRTMRPRNWGTRRD